MVSAFLGEWTKYQEDKDQEATLPERVSEGVTEFSSTNVYSMPPVFFLHWVRKVNWHSCRSSQLLGVAGNTGSVKNIKEFSRAFPGTEWLLWRSDSQPVLLEHHGLQCTGVAFCLTCSANLQQCQSFKGIHIWCDNSNDPFPFSECFNIHCLGVFLTIYPWTLRILELNPPSSLIMQSAMF